MKGKTLIILSLIASIAIVMTSCGTAQVPQVGDKAPDFSLKNIDGKNMSLSDFRGKMVLVVFSSVNCEGCEKQLPYIKAAYEQPNGKLAVLDVYQFDALNKVKDYVASKQLTTFPALPDPKGEVATLYGVARFPPTNFLIDTEGIIRAKKIGPFQSQEEIENMIKSP